MKRMLCLVLVMLLMCPAALAEETVVIPMADGELSFVPFEEGYVLTRETSASVFGQLGMRQREVVPWMEENDLYALMYDAELGCEVQIEILAVTQPDYNDITPEQDADMLRSFTEFYEQYGHVVEDYGMYDNGTHRFGWVLVTQTYADGSVETRIHYRTCHRDYMIEMVMFVLDASQRDKYDRMARELVDSMHYTLNSALVKLGRQDVSIQVMPAMGMTVYPSAEAAGVDVIREDKLGEIVGCMTDPDAKWFVLWHLDESASGDMERLSDAGVRALYQAKEKSRKAAGCTVAFAEDYPDARQRQIHLGYSFVDAAGHVWHAEQYYTKQAGWGVSVTAYSCDQPLTEDVQQLLKALVDSQMVTVNGK